MSHRPRPRQLASYAFLVVFANDDIIDEQELAFLKKLALDDGTIDDEERHVLSNIFKRAEGHDLSPAVRQEIADFKQEWHIP